MGSELQAEEYIGYTIFVVVDGRVVAGRSFAIAQDNMRGRVQEGFDRCI